MEFEQIIELIKAVSDSKLTAFNYEGADLKLSMECAQVQTIVTQGMDMPVQTEMLAAQPVLSQAPAENTTSSQEGNIVTSPLVGTFYATPSEDAAPYVTLGDSVKKGQVIAIVEAMKLMNDIESDFDGKVAEIYVKSGEAVEYGQPLFRIV